MTRCNRLIRRLTCLALAFSLATLPTPSALASTFTIQPSSEQEDSEVQAESPELDAKERFARGVELYEAGDIEAAQVEFLRAYKVAPNYRLLYNIAQSAAMLRDYVTAKHSFEQYLEDGASEIPLDRREYVQKELERLDGYLAHIKVRVNVPQAEIKIDGRTPDPRSQGPEGILVSSGRRTIQVMRQGFEPWETVLDVAGKDQLVLDVDLVMLQPNESAKALTTPPNARASSRPSPDAEKRRMGGLFWTSVSMTALFGAASTALGVLTYNAQQKHNNTIRSAPATQPDIDRSAQELRQLALATDIALIATGTAAVVTIAAAIWGGSRRKKREKPKLRAMILPRGFSVQGRF